MFRLLRAVAVLVFLVGCSSSPPSAEPTSTLEPTSAPTPLATEAATARPTATPAGCPTEQLCAGPVSEGEVTFEVATRTIRFVAGPGWTANVGGRGIGFELIRHGVDTEALSVNAFGGEAFAGPCGDPPQSSSIAATPQALVDYLQAFDGIAVASPPSETTVGGLTGLQLEVAVGAPSACPDVNPLEVYGSERTSVHEFRVGQLARVVALGADDQAIVIVLESFSQAGFDELIATEAGVLDTMTFE